MYAPAPYYFSDMNLAAELVDDIVMGTIVAKDNALTASPLPFRVKTKTDNTLELESHMDKRNPLCDILLTQPEVKIIFWGDNAYLSPSVYAKPPRVPTWLFTSVHISGVVNLLNTPDEVDGVVTALCHHAESVDSPWSVEQVEDYKQRLLSAITGFTVRVTRVEGQLRLGQQNGVAEVARIKSQLSAPEHGQRYTGIISAMEKYLPKS